MDQPLPRPARASTYALASILVLAWLAAGYDGARADFGNGNVVTSLTVYSELMAQAWSEFGFARSLGVPMFHCLGDTVLEREPYAHQAPVGWWFPSLGRTLFGKSPLGFRFFPALFFVAGALLLTRLVWRQGGAAAAVATSVFLALCPAAGLYGALPGVESIAFLAGTLFLTLWHRPPPGARPRTTALGYLALTPFAWSFAFVAPGVFLGELLKPKAERRLGLAFGLGFVQVLGVFLVLLHLAVGTGSFAHTFGELWDKSTEVFTQGLANRREYLGRPTEVAFFSAQDGFSKEALGALGRVAFGVSLLFAFGTRRGRRDPLTRLGVPLLAQGLLSIVVFNARSNTHGYYWLLTAPAFAVYLTVLGRGLGSLIPTPARSWAPALGLAAALAASDFPKALELRRAFEAPGVRAMAEGIDAFVPPGDWIASLDNLVIDACLYSARRWTPPLLTPELIAKVVAARASGEARLGRLWVQLSEQAETVPAVRAVGDWLRAEAAAGRAQQIRLGTLEVFAL